MKINKLLESKKLKESWTHFKFTSGGNPYIAKTEDEVKRMLNKYKGKVKKNGDGSYIVDDSERDVWDKFSVDESKRNKSKKSVMKEDTSYEWKPDTSFKHIKDIYNKVKANDYKYVNNEREEFMAAVKKADAKGYKPEQCRQIKEWHREIWQHNRKNESIMSDNLDMKISQELTQLIKNAGIETRGNVELDKQNKKKNILRFSVITRDIEKTYEIVSEYCANNNLTIIHSKEYPSLFVLSFSVRYNGATTEFDNIKDEWLENASKNDTTGPESDNISDNTKDNDNDKYIPSRAVGTPRIGTPKDASDGTEVSEALQEEWNKEWDNIGIEIEKTARAQNISVDFINTDRSVMGAFKATFEIDRGDWKHDHWAFDEVVKEYLANHEKYALWKIDTNEIGSSLDDCYSAEHIAFIVPKDKMELLNSMRGLFAESKSSKEGTSDYIDSANVNGAIEEGYKVDDLKAYYATSTSIDREKYPNFFVWYDDLRKSGKISIGENINESEEGFDDDFDYGLSKYYDDEYDSSEESVYTEIATKQVIDSDGFKTDYTMYRNNNTGEYVFVFGDKDIYLPDDGRFDWECETREEAEEWFTTYNGFDSGDDDYEWEFDGDYEWKFESLNEEDQTEFPIVHKKSDGSYLVRSSSGDGYTVFNQSDVCVGHISADNDNDAKNKFATNKFDESILRK